MGSIDRLTYLIVCSSFVVRGTAEMGDNSNMEAILARLNQLEERNIILEKTVVEQQRAFEKRIEKLESDILKSCTDDRKPRFVVAPNLPIAFTTRLHPSVLDHVNPGDVITFDDVLTNHGGGLNTSSSIFTAPMAGIYLISCSLMDHIARSDGSGVMLHAGIVKNGNVVLGRVFAHAESGSYRDQGAQTVIVELQNGDRVWIRNFNSKDLGVGGQYYSTFSGYLLWPLE